MNLKRLITVILLFSAVQGLVHAAGEPVNEDLSLLVSLSTNMIELAKQGDAEGFTQAVNIALKHASENRNNSIILPRASAKFRAAKIAIQAGKFAEGIEAVEQAQTILMKKKVLKWDGGS